VEASSFPFPTAGLISLWPLCYYKALSADLQDGPLRKNRKIFQNTMEKMNALHEKDGTHQKQR
jgi:hypothetical protein